MQNAFLLLLVCATVAARAESLSDRYADYGQLSTTQLATAPFPHPKRAEGHTYKGKLFPAAAHYSDSTVGIFIPKGFHETGKIDFIIHFHGWQNNVEGVLKTYKLIEQLVASGRNAVLVVPQGPCKASDSFGGKLEDPEGFKRFMRDVVTTLCEKSSLKNKAFTVGQIGLSGHSGGYQVISAILDHGGLTPQVHEVWLFDALYAQTPRFRAWIDKKQGRLVDIYTEHGGTKAESQQLMATLKQQGTPFFAGNEGAVNLSELQTNRLVFIYTDLPHNDVVHKREQFRDYLKTSCFSALQ